MPNINKQDVLPQYNLSQTVLSQDDLVQDDYNKVIFKIMVLVIYYIITVPFIVCDLYYTFTDKSCIEDPAGHLFINIKTYLQVDGFLNLTLVLIFTFIIMFVNNGIDFITKEKIISILIKPLMYIFNAAWTITGAIMFWGLIDNMECNKGVYNYMYANLIIKLVFISIGVINKKSNDKK